MLKGIPKGVFIPFAERLVSAGKNMTLFWVLTCTFCIRLGFKLFSAPVGVGGVRANLLVAGDLLIYAVRAASLK